MPAEPAAQRSAWGGLLLMVLAALLALLLHLSMGSADDGNPWALHMTPAAVARELVSGDQGPSGSSDNAIVWKIRLPRALACALIGAILGIVGSAFQALFRNPLAEPYVVGVSSGAAVGGALALLLGIAGWASGFGMMLLAFAGGIGALGLVLALAGRKGRTDVQTLLLSGVVIGALLGAVLSLVLYAAGQDTNQILRWLMGMMTPMYWERVGVLAAVLAVGVALLVPQAKRLNALAFSEDSAQRLGVDTGRLKTMILGTGAAMTAVAVGSVGVIGFLGLVAPHIARRTLGVDWRLSMLGAGAVGAVILILADILAQRLVPGAELPVGIVTAVLGAPFLLVLLRREPG